jgi:cytochrome c-type biogenesis protein CcmH/NrfG
MEGDLHQLSQWSREARKAIETGHYEDAARLSRKIDERFPKLIEGPRILAQLSMAQGRWAEAADAYAYAIAIIEGERDSFDPSVLEEMQRGLADARSRTPS